jgi:predicted RNA-binding protein YlqC (UPF0109 family)
MSDTNIASLEKFCQAVVEPMLSRPEELFVTGRRDHPSRTIRISITCDHYDFPRIMGREGRNHNALKMLASIASATLGESVTVYIEPPLSRFQIPKGEFKPQPESKLDPILKSVETIVSLVFHGRTQVAHRSEAHTSWIDVKVDPNEKLESGVIDSIARELRTLVHAQGKSIGRNVYIFVTK